MSARYQKNHLLLIRQANTIYPYFESITSIVLSINNYFLDALNMNRMISFPQTKTISASPFDYKNPHIIFDNMY